MARWIEEERSLQKGDKLRDQRGTPLPLWPDSTKGTHVKYLLDHLVPQVFIGPLGALVLSTGRVAYKYETLLSQSQIFLERFLERLFL